MQIFKVKVKVVGLLPTPAQKGRRRGPSGHPAPFHEASVAALVTMGVGGEPTVLTLNLNLKI